MKVTACLRTNAQLRGIIDEAKAKRRLILEQLHQGRVIEVARELDRLESDMEAVNMVYDLLAEDDLCVA